MTGTTRFFYMLRTQYENLGDQVINRECLALLRKHGSVRVNVVGAPKDFVSGLLLAPNEVCDSNVAFTRELLAARRFGDVVYMVLVPGAVLGDVQPSQIVRQAALIAGYAALKALGVRIIRIGASFGPFTPRRRWIERQKARTMAFIGMRDRLSLAYAQAHSIPGGESFPDFAFMLPAQARPLQGASDQLILSFRADNEDEINALAVAIQKFLANADPYKTLRLLIASQVERDRATGRALAALVADTRSVNYIDVAEGESALMDSYSASAGVLSNRLHVLLFALSRGAPVRALVNPARNRKIIGLFEDAGLGDRLVDIGSPAAIDAMPWPDVPPDPTIMATQRRALLDAFVALLAR